MRDKRLGKFTLSREEIDNYPDNVRLVMKECIIVRAEFMYDRDCIEYTAICDQFSPIPEGGYPYEYKVKIEQEDPTALLPNLTHKVVFEKKY
jgi:hypothetical protein